MTTAPMQPTGTSAGAVTDYVASPPNATRALSLRADYLRTDIDSLGGEVQEFHDDTRKLDLSSRTLEKSKKSVPALLDELASRRGMGWSDIAEVIGVSISAVRKWRRGGDASADNRKGLARIAAYLDLLEEKVLVQDPAAWMEMDLPVPSGYYIRPLDLYLDGHELALIDIAERRREIPVVLDEIRPGWRDERSDFEVFIDDDGERSIRKRSG